MISIRSVVFNMDHIDEDSKCIIETDNGPICGFINKKEENNVFVFRKIPFAKPPVGPLRFLVSQTFFFFNKNKI